MSRFKQKKNHKNRSDQNPLGFPVFHYNINDLFLAIAISLPLIGWIALLIKNNLFFNIYAGSLGLILSLFAMETSIKGQRHIYREVCLFIIFFVSSMIMLFEMQIRLEDMIGIQRPEYPLTQFGEVLAKNFFCCLGIGAVLCYCFFWRYKIVASFLTGFVLSMLGAIICSFVVIYQIYGLFGIAEYGFYVVIASMLWILGVFFVFERYSSRYYKEISTYLNALVFPICFLTSLYFFYPVKVLLQKPSDYVWLHPLILSFFPVWNIFLGIVFNRKSIAMANIVTMFLAVILNLCQIFQMNGYYILFSLFLCGVLLKVFDFFWNFLRSYILRICPHAMIKNKEYSPTYF
ncbi:MAG: hypothetical protein EU981_03670 [Candidatus Liberibacter ctenarytainae]|uniref:Transmembrane protein n=1 Tax=Candidatus Liberibacter ctenarytainae TaxID=2020335 RepID=A0A937AJD7_9HYPH|nr:hypothetical protein [Candidatus Liberibacter ctenarytainae]